MNALESVKKTIDEHCLICEGDVLILGLSGGPDSLCLFDILLKLREKYDFALYALHFNHMVRGEAADEDEKFLREYLASCGVELKVVKEDIPAMAKEAGISVEEMGRRERSKALSLYAEELSKRLNGHPENLPEGCSKTVVKNAEDYEIHPCVVLAHNADDQAETVLLRIIRGTGVHGLAAMEYLREDGLIRPLLDTARIEIEKYCKEYGLNPRMDSTNEKTDYLRNKVRLELLPELAKINPNIKNCLTRLAQNAYDDDRVLQDLTSEWLYNHRTTDNCLLIKDLRGLDTAILQRAVKECFSEIGLCEDISSVHIKALEKQIYVNVGNKTIEFPAGYTAHINHGVLEFRKPVK